MRKIVANWKMYLTLRESREQAALLQNWLRENPCPDAEIIVCPSDLAMADVHQQFSDTDTKLGVQNLSLSAEPGAFTGQTSAQQAGEIGAEYALMGHSEVRKFFHLTDQTVRQQLHAALVHNLHPIVCIGETQEDRETGRTDQVILTQLKTIFEGLPEETEGISIAYEPRWAIGTGKPVEPSEAARMHQLILEEMRHYTANPVSVLYGGSVSEENLTDFLEQSEVHGLLIGSASVRPESLTAILERLNRHFCSL